MSLTRVMLVGPSKFFLSGVSHYLVHLSNALSRRVDVKVICIRKLTPKFLYPLRNFVGKSLSRLEFSREIEVLDGVDFLGPKSWKKALRFIEDCKPSYTIFQWWTASTAHIYSILRSKAQALGGKIVIEMHELLDTYEAKTFPINLYSAIASRVFLNNADLYVTHSSNDRKLVQEKFHIVDGKIRVIPHGLYDHFPSYSRSVAKKKIGVSGSFVILHFGSVRKYKGIPYLIKAFNQLPPPVAQECTLLLTGAIWEGKKEIDRLVNNSPYRERIRVVNEVVPDDFVGLCFSASDLVVLPHLRVSQSGVAHIAMAYGKPVIASDLGGLRESLGGYDGAVFTEPGNEKELRDEILHQIEEYGRGPPPKFEAPDVRFDKTAQEYLRALEYVGATTR